MNANCNRFILVFSMMVIATAYAQSQRTYYDEDAGKMVIDSTSVKYPKSFFQGDDRGIVPKSFPPFIANTQNSYLLNANTEVSVSNPYWPAVDSLVGNWHPSVLYFPNGWGATHAKYWMAWTPNDPGNTAFENPCVAYSNDGINWDTTGLSNPVVNQPADPIIGKHGYNADTFLFYSPLKDTMYLAWKFSEFKCLMKQSGDGIHWGSHAYDINTRVLLSNYKYFCPQIQKDTVIKVICPVLTVEQGGKFFYLYARLGASYTDNWGFGRWTLDSNFQVLDTTYFFPGNSPDSINAWHYDIVKNPYDNHYYLFTDGAVYNQSVWDNSLIWVARSTDTLGKAFDYIDKPLLQHGPWYKVSALFNDQTLMFWWGSILGNVYFDSISVSALNNFIAGPPPVMDTLASFEFIDTTSKSTARLQGFYVSASGQGKLARVLDKTTSNGTYVLADTVDFGYSPSVTSIARDNVFLFDTNYPDSLFATSLQFQVYLPPGMPYGAILKFYIYEWNSDTIAVTETLGKDSLKYGWNTVVLKDLDSFSTARKIDLTQPVTVAVDIGYQKPTQWNGIFLFDNLVAVGINQPSFAIDIVKGTVSPPGTFKLYSNYPNPFNPSTHIFYSLNDAGSVNVSIFDMLGRRIRTLTAGKETSGEHTLVWDGKDGKGMDVPSGVYITQVLFIPNAGGEKRATGKMVLVR
jgi:FlgD Ig-like domain